MFYVSRGRIIYTGENDFVLIARRGIFYILFIV